MKTLFSSKAAKFWVAAVAAFLIAGLTAYEGVMESGVTTQEWLTIAVALLGAATVYLVPNTPPD